ncbi:uncharacterized protein LOC119835854 [Zerene cesonia]|uniref:uncharacterized protein LOC119835854 n=1 Tax=Zerene cesonia TaxID=33412 RepID=UPI0018E56A95|nr:uncharacterized protein LOC119835854 [Zerene cesonia]
MCVVIASSARGHGLLLLYRPRDISDACVFSKHLRYDLSFGMGMSDTITLVFRTLTEIDYGCTIEIVTESPNEHLLVVVRYPTSVSSNCEMNRDAFTMLKKWRCIRFCDVTDANHQTHYFTFHVKDRLRFRFVSNSSINADLNAHFYQVTVTSARLKPRSGCLLKNETICTVGDDDFCFTSGVVCDGIKNCGVDDWFDERKSQCSLPVERLGFAPVVAVMAAIFCALLALAHTIQRCLPPLADSFFIFNANEDNRLCIDPLLVPGDTAPPDIPIAKRNSIIPVFSSSSSEEERGSRSESGLNVTDVEMHPISINSQQEELSFNEDTKEPESSTRKSNLKSLTDRLQETFRSFTRRRSSLPKPNIV